MVLMGSPFIGAHAAREDSASELPPVELGAGDVPRCGQHPRRKELASERHHPAVSRRNCTENDALFTLSRFTMEISWQSGCSGYHCARADGVKNVSL
jgi:hypothetical protein